ncbi:hypothetical protein LTR53_007725 [Teratosphaeriaceae sp. CCFEE 6253]|nr:hypothetical protein LTR53_007725 [Teratosphaeriaceae sp. CCFEE 6253]
MADPESKVFFSDLFGLAQEVRDMIYYETLADSKALQASNHEGVHLHVHGVPRTELLLANHRVQAEYTAMWIKTATLVAADYVGDYDSNLTIRVDAPGSVRAIEKMEMDFFLKKSPPPKLLRVNLHIDAVYSAETRSDNLKAYIASLAVLLDGYAERSLTVWAMDSPLIEHFLSHEDRRALMRWDLDTERFMDVDGATAEDVPS